MLLVDENQTDMERLIKALGKELSKSQDYSNSSEHKNPKKSQQYIACLLYTSDAADEL